jgi:hypothetical protein
MPDQTHRTRAQEIRHIQGMAYAWGRQDGSKWDESVNSIAFAHWYAAVKSGDLCGAFEEFAKLSFVEQTELGDKYKLLYSID